MSVWKTIQLWIKEETAVEKRRMAGRLTGSLNDGQPFLVSTSLAIFLPTAIWKLQHWCEINSDIHCEISSWIYSGRRSLCCIQCIKAKALMLRVPYPISTAFYGIHFQVSAQGTAEVRLKLKNKQKAVTKMLFSCESGSLQVHLTWWKAFVASDTICLARNVAESARPREIVLLQQ